MSRYAVQSGKEKWSGYGSKRGTLQKLKLLSPARNIRSTVGFYRNLFIQISFSFPTALSVTLALIFRKEAFESWVQLDGRLNCSQEMWHGDTGFRKGMCCTVILWYSACINKQTSMPTFEMENWYLQLPGRICKTKQSQKSPEYNCCCLLHITNAIECCEEQLLWFICSLKWRPWIQRALSIAVVWILKWSCLVQ